MLAEIYMLSVCWRNANGLGVSFEEELNRVMIHGVLHLCGYDDHEEEDIKVMRQKEEAYLKV